MKNRNWVQAILTFMFSALSEDWKGNGEELMKRALRYYSGIRKPLRHKANSPSLPTNGTVNLAPQLRSCLSSRSLFLEGSPCTDFTGDHWVVQLTETVVESKIAQHTSEDTPRQWSTVYYASGSKGNQFPARTLVFLRGPVLYPLLHDMLATSLLYMIQFKDK